MLHGDDIGLIVSAIVTGIFGLFIAWQNNRLHRAIKTNHGKRPGEYLEKISEKQDRIEEKQGVIALALVGAQSKVDGVARALVVSERKRDAEAQTMREHIEADTLFQERVEPFLIPTAA